MNSERSSPEADAQTGTAAGDVLVLSGMHMFKGNGENDKCDDQIGQQYLHTLPGLLEVWYKI